jgi:hypothetical protein
MTDTTTLRDTLADGPVLLSRELFDFLMGKGEIDGTSFGDLNNGLPGRFWWRALLRAAERETRSALSQSEVEKRAIERCALKLDAMAHNAVLPVLIERYGAEAAHHARDLLEGVATAIRALQPETE